MNPETKTCQNCSQKFTIEPEDFGFYEKIKVPPPTFCYLCRAQRRMTYRNERALFKRTSSMSGETIFSTYPTDVPFPVYTQEEWYSDDWDPMDYGRDYDFSRPFFEQFKELSFVVPKPAKSAYFMGADTEYSNNAAFLKNCYMTFNSAHSEDCAYCTTTDESNNCIDNTFLHRVELSYENFNMGRSSRVFFSDSIADSTDIWFSKGLKGCNSCFGCMNLRGKSYHIFNEPYSKEEYEKKVKELYSGSYKELMELTQKAREHWLRYPHKFMSDGSKSVDVSGEYVFHSKNVKYSYQVFESEDSKYCQYINFPPTKDCYDYLIYGTNAERIYESAMVGENSSNLRFCLQTWIDMRDSEYTEYCSSSSNLFGCVSLRKKQYCIFNKQYSKKEYKELVPRIRKHMNDMPYTDKGGRVYKYGEFFPAEFSPFGYNETIAQEHFPLTKEETLRRGYNWRDVDPPEHPATIKAADLPDHIKDADKNILQEVIGCAHEGNCDHGCTKAFRLILSELDFYRRFNLPLPRLCPSCRHRERLKKRNSVRLYDRKCQCAGSHSDGKAYKNDVRHFHGSDHCPNEFETSYGPDRAEIIYCKQCYDTEVV